MSNWFSILIWIVANIEETVKLSLKARPISKTEITRRLRNWRGWLSPIKPSSRPALAFTLITSSRNQSWLKTKTSNSTSTKTPGWEMRREFHTVWIDCYWFISNISGWTCDVGWSRTDQAEEGWRHSTSTSWLLHLRLALHATFVIIHWFS